MLKFLTLLIICFLDFTTVNAQTKPEYFIADTENGQFLIYGTRFLINSPNNACYEFIDGINLSKGKIYIILHITDEPGNGRGVIIFDKKGHPIN